MDGVQDDWFVVDDVSLELCDGASVEKLFQIAREILIAELVWDLVFKTGEMLNFQTEFL